jgi:hypothetical protein
MIVKTAQAMTELAEHYCERHYGKHGDDINSFKLKISRVSMTLGSYIPYATWRFPELSRPYHDSKENNTGGDKNSRTLL